MTRKIIVLAVIFLALPFAHADEASKRVKIEEMFVVLHIDRTMKQMMEIGMAQGKQAATSIMGDHPLSPADQKIADDYMAKLYAAVTDALSWEKLKPAYVDLYASEYTEEQVEGIIAFYKSSIGQALLDKTPDLLTKSTAIVQARMQDFGPRMQQITEDMQKQLIAAHKDKAPSK